MRDKAQEIEVMAKQYEDEILEPELRPEYLQKAEKIKQEKAVRIGDVKQLRKLYE